jgi:hypothetical protein
VQNEAEGSSKGTMMEKWKRQFDMYCIDEHCTASYHTKQFV